MQDNFSPKPNVAGPSRGSALAVFRRPIERLAGLAYLQRVYDRRPPGCHGLDLMRWSLDDLGIRYCTDEADMQRIPETGPVVFVGNHPFGGVEGIVLGALLGSRRQDVRILANYFLGRMAALRDVFLLVDPFKTRGAERRNLSPIRAALRWLEQGGALVVFPAGEVAHFNPRSRRIEDPPWSPAAARLARRAGCPVVPVYFPGRNRIRFQLLGLIHPRLRTIMLAREMIARRGTTVEARIGTPIPQRQLAGYAGDDERTDYLRSRTYILSERHPVGGVPVQPRETPRAAQPLAPESSRDAQLDEVRRLPSDQLLVDAGDQSVYIADANQIPTLLQEIGRLREMTFREVGEGTGRERDLDLFDPSYRHLFIWSNDNNEVVGAYRVGLSDKLLRDKGIAGLYTSTLFSFEPRLFESMGPALEVGRSFIRPEYQKSYTGLLLLWKGIGHYVIRHPHYTTLFGPVSISADYRSASQRLIVSFLEQNRYVHDWSRWVHPHTPTSVERAPSYPLGPSQLRDLEDVSTFISEIEADHKGVPILLKQYLKLGGRLLGFNVDPEFSNVLDVLIMVDLRQTAQRILARYMGRDGSKAFLAGHAAGKEQAG